MNLENNFISKRAHFTDCCSLLSGLGVSMQTAIRGRDVEGEATRARRVEASNLLLYLETGFLYIVPTVLDLSL